MAEVIRPKLEAAGADLDLVEVRKLNFPRALNDRSPFVKAVENDGVQLIVMDTVSDNTGASIYNVRAIRDAIGPLVEFADEYDVAVLFISHTIKKIDPKADPLAAIGGSQGGLGAMCRCAYVWGYAPDDEDERILAHLKCNIASRRTSLRFEMDVRSFDDGISAPFLTYLGEDPKLRASAIFNAQPIGAKPERLEAAAEWIVKLLSSQPDGAMLEEGVATLALADGMSMKKLRTAATEIGCTFARTMWKLPPSPLEANTDRKHA